MNVLRQKSPLLGLMMLAALDLTAAHPQVAHAQSLTLGGTDTVTVSSLGTHGTINNSTASYNDNDGKGYAVETTDDASFTLGSGGTLSATEEYSYGLLDQSSGAVTVTGGTITTTGEYGNGLEAYGNHGPLTISGGTISSTGKYGIGLDAFGSGTFTVTGGTITASTDGFGLVIDDGSSIDLYGSFSGLTLGETKTLPSDSGGIAAIGSFFGTLEENTVGQTFTYDNDGILRLHDVGNIAPTPEPSPVVGLVFAGLGLAGRMLRKRRQNGSVA